MSGTTTSSSTTFGWRLSSAARMGYFCQWTSAPCASKPCPEKMLSPLRRFFQHCPVHVEASPRLDVLRCARNGAVPGDRSSQWRPETAPPRPHHSTTPFSSDRPSSQCGSTLARLTVWFRRWHRFSNSPTQQTLFKVFRLKNNDCTHLV